MEPNKMTGCGCSHHKVMPVILILLGLTFLLGTLDILTAAAVGVIWPILLIIFGFVKLGSGRCKCCENKQ